jgi:hypothetical protein
VALAFSFYPQATNTSFAQVAFVVPQGAVKWALSISGGWPFGPQTSSFTLQVLLSLALGNRNSSTAQIKQLANTPTDNITTYYIQLVGSLFAAQLEMFDVALADGTLVPVNHSLALIQADNNNNEDDSSVEVQMSITINRFEAELEYDPSLSLVTLVEGNSGVGGGSSITWIIAVAVVVPVAVLTVAIIVGGVLVMAYKKRAYAKRLAHFSQTVNNSSSSSLI